MQGHYSTEIRIPQSPSSVGVYQLQIDEHGQFVLLCRMLMDTPEDRDWRAEWSVVEGSVTTDGEQLRFTIARGQREVRSSAWSGRGAEDYHPTDVFHGTLTPDGISIQYFGQIDLRQGAPREMVRALIVPDYIFS
ncbi:MAG: hypothetical protein AAFV53_09075 [Myxococcota bacterium]